MKRINEFKVDVFYRTSAFVSTARIDRAVMEFKDRREIKVIIRLLGPRVIRTSSRRMKCMSSRFVYCDAPAELGLDMDRPREVPRSRSLLYFPKSEGFEGCKADRRNDPVNSVLADRHVCKISLVSLSQQLN